MEETETGVNEKVPHFDLLIRRIVAEVRFLSKKHIILSE